MMREILFRAKRKDNDEWIYGYPMRHPQAVQVGPYEPYWDMFVPPADPDDTGGVFRIDPDTLCQYTGLEDIGGKRIYEDDICIIHIDSMDEEDGYFYVSWDDDTARFVLWGSSIQLDFDLVHGSDCEVVGNIFDNPKLLKAEYIK